MLGHYKTVKKLKLKIMRNYKYRNKEWLNEQKWTLNKTYEEIAKECKVCVKTITNWLKRFEIINHPIRICEICKKEVHRLFEITDHRNIKFEKVCNVCRDSIKATLKLRLKPRGRKL